MSDWRAHHVIVLMLEIEVTPDERS